MSCNFTIPDGQFAITLDMDDRLRFLSRSKPRNGDRAHPIFAFVGALGGMGIKIADLSSALSLDFAAGPLLARSKLVYHAPLLVDRTYAVTAQIEALERKPSRTFGHAEHLNLAIRLADDVARSTAHLHIIFPAKDAT